jgi:lysozyme family protein
MKTPFERAFARLLAEEGGFVDDPRDPGGATNLGVTLNTLREIGWDLDGDGDIDVDDVRLLTPDHARRIARERYWDRVNGDALPSLVNELAFDFAYHSGPTTAVKLLQRVVGADQDGRVGQQTINACCRLDSDDLAARYLAERNLYMVAAKDRLAVPLWPSFGRGWSRRLFRLSMDMARVI